LNKIDFNESFFETIDSEEKAYWLGFIAADGCILIVNKNSNPSYRLSIGLSEKDLNHLEKFKKSIELNHKLYKRENKYNYKDQLSIKISYHIRIHSKKMFNDLLDKGITPRKSLTLKPPLNVPEDLIRHWIRGYFDGDGSVGIRKNIDTLSIQLSGTKEVLEFILKESEIDWKIRLRDRSKAHFIGGSHSKALKFLSLIYLNSNIYLDRKFLIYENF
jgi:intein/homing endonuclease